MAKGMASAIALLVIASLAVVRAEDVEPAPPSIGTDVPLTYFGPPPSSVHPFLVGPVQLLKSGTIDTSTNPATITLPVYKGYTNISGTRTSFWYIATDTSSKDLAEALGINFSSKLKFTQVDGLYRRGKLDSALTLTVENGWVDFSPVRQVVPGASPNYFPPRTAVPGSVGKDGYTPLVLVGDVMYNFPVVAGNLTADQLDKWCDGIEGDEAAAHAVLLDKVVKLCAEDNGRFGGGTVTLQLTAGFTFAKPLLYLSTEASVDVAAALEEVTYAPALDAAARGGDDSLFSPVERLFAVVNGHTNGDIPVFPRLDNMPKETVHPLRQGFNSALRGEGFPLNVLGGIPTVATDYSPLWDVNLGAWTKYAIVAGYRTRLVDEFQVLGFAQQGHITKPDGTPYGSSGIIVNCPPAMRFL